jgi:hypothetical protein
MLPQWGEDFRGKPRSYLSFMMLTIQELDMICFTCYIVLYSVSVLFNIVTNSYLWLQST